MQAYDSAMQGFLYRSLDALYHGAVASTTGGQEIKHHRFFFNRIPQNHFSVVIALHLSHVL